MSQGKIETTTYCCERCGQEESELHKIAGKFVCPACSQTTVPTWRQDNVVTDWEFSRVGTLLCEHAPRDLALMVVRLQGDLEIERMLGERVKDITHAG